MSAVSVFKYLKTDYGVFHLLFILTIFVNKYVLSVVGFTYPTVYQGWQTLVGAFILLYLRPNLLTQSSQEPNRLDCINFIKLLPNLLLYVCFIICGSKALAIIPIPVYVCAQNTSSLFILLYSMKQVNLFDFLVALTGLLSSLFLFLYIGFMEIYGFHPWPILFVIISILLELLNQTGESSQEIYKLYYRNIFSFVFLMPCSLYLGEAFAALHFKYIDQIGFYAGCMASGISGIFLQLSSIKLSKHREHHFASVASRLTSLLASLVLFDNSSISEPIWLLIITQIMSTVIFTYNIYRTDSKSVLQENII